MTGMPTRFLDDLQGEELRAVLNHCLPQASPGVSTLAQWLKGEIEP